MKLVIFIGRILRLIHEKTCILLVVGLVKKGENLLFLLMHVNYSFVDSEIDVKEHTT